ncbi:MAG: hypothetical protein U5K33_04360 [Halofilum sp. (in: g-proteobacteria)]|nr:hypothetical protein [Halofilum sp. (in: g-proteobacteria)]
MTLPGDSPRLLRLRVAFKLATAVGVVTVAAVVLAYLGGGASKPPGTSARFTVSELAPGQSRRIDWNGRPVIVVRPAGAGEPGQGWFVAFASGTAMGCPVSWEPAQETFLETCSGTRYDARGRPIDADRLAPLKTPPHHFDAAGRLVIGRD